MRDFVLRLKPGFANALYVVNIMSTLILNLIYIMLKSFVHYDTSGEGSLESVREITHYRTHRILFKDYKNCYI